ncbi:MAG: hypothetical protein WCY89_02915 [Flavobacteriaceae bacterium]
MKKKFLNTIGMVLFFITSTTTAWAEPLPPTPTPPNFPFDPDPTGDEAASIDHKMILLVMAAIIWSFLFFRNTLKKQAVPK